MTRGVMAAFGTLGALIGLVVGVLIELNTPDGFACLPSSWPTETTALSATLSSFFKCWIIAIFCAAILGLVGTAFGAVISQIGGGRQ